MKINIYFIKVNRDFQVRSVVGRARKMGLFDERPWYGSGGYLLLAVVLILVSSYLIHRFLDDLNGRKSGLQASKMPLTEAAFLFR